MKNIIIMIMGLLVTACGPQSDVTVSEYQGCTLERTGQDLVFDCGEGGYEVIPIPRDGIDAEPVEVTITNECKKSGKKH